MQKFREAVPLLYNHSAKIYSNATVTEGKVGITVIYDEEVVTYKITSQSSVSSAEAFAIY